MNEWFYVPSVGVKLTHGMLGATDNINNRRFMHVQYKQPTCVQHNWEAVAKSVLRTVIAEYAA